HLTGHKALIDQRIESQLIPRQQVLDALRCIGEVRGADRFMRFLCTLAGGVAVRLSRQVRSTVLTPDVLPAGAQGIIGDSTANPPRNAPWGTGAGISSCPLPSAAFFFLAGTLALVDFLTVPSSAKSAVIFQNSSGLKS